MHFMDLVSRFSIIKVVDSVKMENEVVTFEESWVSQFWHPELVHVDKKIQIGYFKSYMEQVGREIRPVSPGHHRKNAIESKHRVIRSIYLRLREAAGINHYARIES